MKGFVLYARSATSQDQADRQLQSMEDFLSPGVNVVGHYSELASGIDSQRPELQLALQQVLNGDADALMVTSLDRLTRSVLELTRLLSVFEVKILEELPDRS